MKYHSSLHAISLTGIEKGGRREREPRIFKEKAGNILNTQLDHKSRMGAKEGKGRREDSELFMGDSTIPRRIISLPYFLAYEC